VEAFHVLFYFGDIMKRIINKIIKLTKGSDNDSGSDEPEEKKDSKKKEDKKEDLMAMLMSGGGGDERPESRILMLHSELNEEKSMEIMSTFIALTRLVKPKEKLKKGEKKYDPITFYISTYGGSADEMFGLYDMMSQVKKDCVIETIGMGKVMSAGTLLLAAGTKGHRKIGKSCRVMLHQVSAAAIGPLFNMTAELEAIQKMQDMYVDIMVSCTSLSKRKLKSLLNERVNVYLTAKEALEYGLVDEII
jgi:ATP-dependent Clp protease, protease subunit